MSSELCLRSGSTAAAQQPRSIVTRSKQVARIRKRPAAAPRCPVTTGSAMPKVPTFAGRRSSKKSDEWVDQFNAIVTAYEEGKASCKKKGIKFDMTQRQYWNMVLHRGSGLIVCLPV